MDKSYIIRIYQRDNETVSGIVEDIELNKREKFSNSSQLWSLINSNTKEQPTSNVIQPKIFNVMRNNKSN